MVREHGPSTGSTFRTLRATKHLHLVKKQQKHQADPTDQGGTTTLAGVSIESRCLNLAHGQFFLLSSAHIYDPWMHVGLPLGSPHALLTDLIRPNYNHGGSASFEPYHRACHWGRTCFYDRTMLGSNQNSCPGMMFANGSCPFCRIPRKKSSWVSAASPLHLSDEIFDSPDLTTRQRSQGPLAASAWLAGSLPDAAQAVRMT